MNDSPNYPSCIKIPLRSTEQDITTDAKFPQKIDLKETKLLYNELVLIADRMFGERKWSHVVTNQTIDTVESFMGKYVCGCVTFLKIQLPDGTFHEDMGYCHTESAMKSVSMHYARIGSHVDAFKRVLSCFGKEIECEIDKLSKTLKVDKIKEHKEGLEHLEPLARSTPRAENTKETGSRADVIRNKNSNIWDDQTIVQPNITKPKIAKPVQKPLEAAVDNAQQPVKSSKEQSIKDLFNNGQSDQNSKKVLSDEELLRMERKRKQMEKQAEYKRLMKEKAQLSNRV